MKQRFEKDPDVLDVQTTTIVAWSAQKSFINFFSYQKLMDYLYYQASGIL